MFDIPNSLAQTYAKDGINVNTIAPGVIDNGFHVAHTPREAMEAMAHRIPQQRFGRNEEVKFAVQIIFSHVWRQ